MTKGIYPLVDVHTHVLPGMDDGAKDSLTAINMIKMLIKQDVKLIFATSHYYNHKEKIEDFLERRKASYNRLEDEWRNLGMEGDLPVFLGAEVSLERDIQYCTGLERLCLQGTNIILTELPYDNLKGWEMEAIENISYKFHVRPMIAHIDRYTDVYEDKDYDSLFSIPDLIYQFDISALNERRSRSFLLNLYKRNYPILLGSDCHNLHDRKPAFDDGIKILKKKLDEKAYEKLKYEMNVLLKTI